jgi:hypothetical protein
MAGTCECGNEPSGSIKFGEYLDWLRTGWLLKKDSAPWIKQVSVCQRMLHRERECNVFEIGYVQYVHCYM